ncbi:pentatricopeptide repeat-containing protein isoform X1 [Cinnamomum micranthum f. kanehirae]|uniref:Pentatricopeptide repeat-containing protein isoform X1 n=1 Tax=Cinnamomum micranthum f. kanehirae TaxID=337451 RepID=A0A443NDG3_9MAGN|nr:pentatricopeptide repeat-containing protein isoform X1 [Cinnamomum micranthum f. kanehirae]
MKRTTPRFSLLNQHSNLQTHTEFIHQLQNSQDLKTAAKTHSNIFKSGLSNHTFTANHLLNAYLRFNKITDARKLFDEMPETNVVSWTALMAGYIDVGEPKEALLLFGRMAEVRIQANEFTLATAINACSLLADLETGRKIHTRVETLGLWSNLVISSALIDLYGKSNDVDNARQVFDHMICRNVISWTSMISAYAQNAQGDDALDLFRELIYENSLALAPTQFTFASVISACASLGRLIAGKAVHLAVIRRCHVVNDVVASALVDMYAKCGCIDYSDKVFRQILQPSVIPFTSMIVGAAKHGLGKHSLHLFDEMLARGIRPNNVTLVGVLYACSHSGLIDVGLYHFNSMQEKHGIAPDARHYTCVIDMLGRAGRLDEAYKLLIENVPLGAVDAALMWGTLLSACRNHGRLELAVKAGKRLLELNQQVASTYVTMSNMYASIGRWENAQGIRSEMKRRGVRKEPGCSWVEVRNSTYVFYAGDLSSCTHGSEIAQLLRDLEVRMKERGYVGGSSGLVFVDVEEEAKEGVVGLHSERLALGFGLINIPKGVTIRVMKNLRMCGDCHEAFKLISEIVARDFVVRDVNRFHHFRDGSCTCGDYW